MKLMFASDLHGSFTYTQKVIEAYQEEQAEKLILLGDLLYHGPRNSLPAGYDPQKVADLLNSVKEQLLCVRGNCDADVDQMVLAFPIMADYMILYLSGRMIFVTHGHLYHQDHLPMLKQGDVLLHGHTHVQAMDDKGDYYYLNPGSAALPKDGNAPSYMIWEDGVFTIKDMERRPLRTLDLSRR